MLYKFVEHIVIFRQLYDSPAKPTLKPVGVDTLMK